MSRRQARSLRRGFTLIEVTIASSLLAVALFTSLSISHAASRASNQAVLSSVRESAVLRNLDRLRRSVTCAAASTLLACPAPKQGQYDVDPVPEPMQDGVAYDNVSFREPVGFVDGETQYEPPLFEEPRRLELERAEGAEVGTLVLTDANHRFEFARDVLAVSFTRRGGQVDVEITTLGAEPNSGPAMSRLSVALHAR